MTAPTKRPRGFAAMDPTAQKILAARGGRAIPAAKRTFSLDRQLAAESGRKGGSNVPAELRQFAKNRALAIAAGRKGGRQTQKRRMERLG